MSWMVASGSADPRTIVGRNPPVNSIVISPSCRAVSEARATNRRYTHRYTELVASIDPVRATYRAETECNGPELSRSRATTSPRRSARPAIHHRALDRGRCPGGARQRRRTVRRRLVAVVVDDAGGDHLRAVVLVERDVDGSPAFVADAVEGVVVLDGGDAGRDLFERPSLASRYLSILRRRAFVNRSNTDPATGGGIRRASRRITVRGRL